MSYMVADAQTFLRSRPSGSVDLVMTSPPYPGLKGCSMQVDAWTDWMLEIFRWMDHALNSQHGVIAFNAHAGRCRRYGFPLGVFALVDQVLRRWDWTLADLYVWDKLNPAPSGNMQRHDIPGWEPVFVIARPGYRFFPQRAPYSMKTVGKCKEGNRPRSGSMNGAHTGGHSRLHPEGARRSNVLRISSSGDQGRPRVAGNSFPRGLAEHFIRTYTEPGDLVVDPFCGAGTTCWSAQRLGRRWCGSDISVAAVMDATNWMKEQFGAAELAGH